MSTNQSSQLDEPSAKRQKLSFNDLAKRAISVLMRYDDIASNMELVLNRVKGNHIVIRGLRAEAYDELAALVTKFPIIAIELLEGAWMFSDGARAFALATIKAFPASTRYKIFYKACKRTHHVVRRLIDNEIIQPTDFHPDGHGGVLDENEAEADWELFEECIDTMVLKLKHSPALFIYDAIVTLSRNDEMRVHMLHKYLDLCVPDYSGISKEDKVNIFRKFVKNGYSSWDEIALKLFQTLLDTPRHYDTTDRADACIIRCIILDRIPLSIVTWEILLARLPATIPADFFIHGEHQYWLMSSIITSIVCKRYDVIKLAVKYLLTYADMENIKLYKPTSVRLYRLYVTGVSVAPKGLLERLLQSPAVKKYIVSRECGIKSVHRVFGSDICEMVTKYL